MSTASMAVDAAARAYHLGEFHRFQAEGAQFLYLVPAGAIFVVDREVGQADRFPDPRAAAASTAD